MSTISPAEFDPKSALIRLGQLDVIRYFKDRGMPIGTEELVVALLRWLRASSPEIRNTLLNELTPKAAMPLGWYARKAAGLCVRNTSIPILEQGILAILFAAAETSSYDLLSPLSLLYRSALHLRVDPRPLFLDISTMGGESGANLLRSFVVRADVEIAYTSFGFSEGFGPEGFDYIPLLPEYGGPIPV